MGQIDLKYCKKCEGITKHTWEVDRDSSPGEPDFSQECQRCEGIDDFITKLHPDDSRLGDFI